MFFNDINELSADVSILGGRKWPAIVIIFPNVKCASDAIRNDLELRRNVETSCHEYTIDAIENECRAVTGVRQVDITCHKVSVRVLVNERVTKEKVNVL